jgi:hypothetical protein
LLAYLQNDDELPEVAKLQSGKSISHYVLKMLGFDFLVALIVVLAFGIGFHFVNFHGAYVISDNVRRIVICSLVACACLFGIMLCIFTKPVIKLIVDKADRNWVIDKLKDFKY